MPQLYTGYGACSNDAHLKTSGGSIAEQAQTAWTVPDGWTAKETDLFDYSNDGSPSKLHKYRSTYDTYAGELIRKFDADAYLTEHL